MLVLLPDKMDGVYELEKYILKDSSQFPILIANLTKHKVVLALPKFKFETKLNLKSPMNNVSIVKISKYNSDVGQNINRVAYIRENSSYNIFGYLEIFF